MNKITYVILAAGNGSRFLAGKNKLLHDLCGKPLIEYALDKVLGEQVIVVTSPAVDEILRDRYRTVVQQTPQGTGAAFLLALEHIDHDSDVFILLGDMPLLRKQTIARATSMLAEHDLVFGKFKSQRSDNQYGRVLDQDGKYFVREFSEHRDESDFYNAGWLCLRRDLVEEIRASGYKHKTQEIYLTRYIEMARKAAALQVRESECIGVNTLEEYEQAYTYMQRALRESAVGVNFIDPSTVKLCFDTRFHPGVTVHPNVVFGPGVTVAANAEILPFTVIEHSKIGEGCRVGPFCYIRNGTELKSQSQAGAFCEIKNSTLGNGTKSKHLSYIGDTTLGDRVNVGAGSVFLNYDGVKKNPCTVGDDTFLGGNSCYVAPVNIGAESYIGAGTVVREDVPDNSIYVTKPKNLQCRRK